MAFGMPELHHSRVPSSSASVLRALSRPTSQGSVSEGRKLTLEREPMDLLEVFILSPTLALKNGASETCDSGTTRDDLKINITMNELSHLWRL